jgi:hypothetical protein
MWPVSTGESSCWVLWAVSQPGAVLSKLARRLCQPCLNLARDAGVAVHPNMSPSQFPLFCRSLKAGTDADGVHADARCGAAGAAPTADKHSGGQAEILLATRQTVLCAQTSHCIRTLSAVRISNCSCNILAKPAPQQAVHQALAGQLGEDGPRASRTAAERGVQRHGRLHHERVDHKGSR